VTTEGGKMDDSNETKEYPVVWLQGASCSGCSISVLNAASPTIKHLLIDEVIPGRHVNLRFHPTVMAGSGEVALEVLEGVEQELRGGYLLVVEGAIPTAEGYCSVGEVGDAPVSILSRVESLGRKALAVIALGTCAAFGGIPAAEPNPGKCVGVGEVFSSRGISTPFINIPGCPPHPDWFVGMVAAILLNGLPKPEELDEFRRPKAFYGKLIHENCPRRAYFDEGKFAQKFGDEGCLYELGCKGPVTYADCPLRLWNNGTNWCIGNGAPCMGCVEPGFPDVVSPLYEKITDVPIPVIGECWKEET